MHSVESFVIFIILSLLSITAHSEYREYFSVLGIAPTGDMREIKAAFRQAVLKEHPDRGGNEERFKKIVSAYESLKKHANDNPQFVDGHDINQDSPFSDEDFFWESYRSGLANRRRQSEKLTEIIRATLDNRITRVEMLTPVEQFIRVFFAGQNAFYLDDLLKPSLVEPSHAVLVEEKILNFVSLPDEAYKIYVARFRGMVAQLDFLKTDKEREFFVQSFFQRNLGGGVARFINGLAMQEPDSPVASHGAQEAIGALIEGVATTIKGNDLIECIQEINKDLFSEGGTRASTYILGNRAEIFQLLSRALALNSDKATEVRELELFKMLGDVDLSSAASPVSCETSLHEVRYGYARLKKEMQSFGARLASTASWARPNKKRF